MGDGSAIGIIGGSGLYEIEGFEGREELEVPTPFGNPSDSITGGVLAGRKVYFLPRHGRFGYLVDVIAANSRCQKAEDARVVRHLLQEAARRLERMGAFVVRGWTINDHPFDRLVRRAAYWVGFAKVSRGHTVVLHTAFGISKRAGVDDFGRWYVTRIFTEGLNG